MWISFLALLNFLVLPTDIQEISRDRLLRIALEQAEYMSGYWDPSQRDCAGFVRFLYHQAIPNADKLWMTKEGEPVDYVSAAELVAYNFSFVTKDVTSKQIRTGDILAFYSEHKKPKDAWHLMIYLRPPQGAPDKVLLMYHNGKQGNEGRVQKVWLSDLMKIQATQWHPKASNPRFLGAFHYKGWGKAWKKG